MISLRCSIEEEQLIKQFASSINKSVSEFLREAALQKIEEEHDLKIIQEYLAKKSTMKFYTADEVEKELGL